ncbi:MAG: hypothetical protein JWR61_340 [Ferruginibacter sp.]|nr:hypothetical protein [Ferruginibacter sp.]
MYHQLTCGPAFRSKSCLTAAAVAPGFPLQSGVGIQPHRRRQHLQSKTGYQSLSLLQKSSCCMPEANAASKTIVPASDANEAPHCFPARTIFIAYLLLLILYRQVLLSRLLCKKSISLPLTGILFLSDCLHLSVLTPPQVLLLNKQLLIFLA